MHLVRIAWHLGNRHLPTQIMTKGLRIRRDHVIEEMVRGLGARVIEIEAPFDPEGGAYASAAAGHAHDHAHHEHDHHGHDHAHHGHGHDHARSPSPRARRGMRSITSMTTPITITATPTGTVMGRARALTCRASGSDATGDDLNRTRRALPADDLAVAVVPGRRILLLQRHRVGGRGRRHHRRRDAARRWLSAMLSDGAGFCDGVLLCHAWRASAGEDDTALAEVAELAAAFTPSRERHLETTAQGRAFADIAARRLALRLRWSDCWQVWSGRDRLSGRRRHRRGRSRRTARSDAARLPARADGELDFRGRPADPARTDRQPARSGRARARRGLGRLPRARWRRSTTSAARRSAPTLRACITRRSIRGCSGHEHERANGDITGREAAQSEPARPVAGRHRRSGRLRQDGADGLALQEHARRPTTSPPSPTTSTRSGTPNSWCAQARSRPTASPASRPAAVRTPRSARTPR